MNKCYLLIKALKKKLAQIRLVVFQKNVPLIPKNDVTEPKVRRLGYSNNQLKSSKQVKEQFQSSENHGFRKPETDF